MELAMPEELSHEQIHNLVVKIKEKHPLVFAEIVDVYKLGSFQKLLILDNLLMDHPDLYCTFFEQKPER